MQNFKGKNEMKYSFDRLKKKHITEFKINFNTYFGAKR